MKALDGARSTLKAVVADHGISSTDTWMTPPSRWS